MAINIARRLMVSIVILSAAVPMRAKAVPTSRQIPFNNVRTTISPGTTGQTLTIQLWDMATGGTLVFSETQTLDVDANRNISFVFGSATTEGLTRIIFPPGQRDLWMSWTRPMLACCPVRPAGLVRMR